MEREKERKHVKAIFSNAMISCYLYFYLHYFTLFTITFGTYNKTKALFTKTKALKRFEN